jgi:hypothetical protein
MQHDFVSTKSKKDQIYLLRSIPMSHRNLKSLVIAVILLTAFSLRASAEESVCWLSASVQNDVWVIVYNETRDGERIDTIWEGKIEAGKKVKIKSETGHIRYSYAREEGQPYEGDLSRWCDSGKKIQLP